MEGDRAVDIAFGTFRTPDDPLVGHLVQDGGLPVPARPQDATPPLEFGVGDLLDALDLLHEPGKVGEPGPLVVGNPHRDSDVDLLDDVGHLGTLLASVPAAATITTAGDLLSHLLGRTLDAAGQPAFDRLLGDGTAAAGGLHDLLTGTLERAGGLLGDRSQLAGQRLCGALASHLQQFPDLLLELVGRQLVDDATRLAVFLSRHPVHPRLGFAPGRPLTWVRRLRSDPRCPPLDRLPFGRC